MEKQLQDQFTFMVRSFPGYYHKATVKRDKVIVEWDAEYSEVYLPCWWDCELGMARKWIEEGGWIVGPPSEAAVELQRQLLQLRMAVDALEENLQSVKENLERVISIKGV